MSETPPWSGDGTIARTPSPTPSGGGSPPDTPVPSGTNFPHLAFSPSIQESNDNDRQKNLTGRLNQHSLTSETVPVSLFSWRWGRGRRTGTWRR